MKTILLLNHKEHACGVYQWGFRTNEIILFSKKYQFLYSEVTREDEFRELVKEITPDAVIYNYHPATMPWLNPSLLDEFRIYKPVVIIHEGFAHPENEHSFDYYIYIDPAMDIEPNWSHKVFKVGRPLLKYNGEHPKTDVVTVGSFGFGFANKRYELIVRQVNKEFDNAVINLLIPFATFGDSMGDAARLSVEKCRQEITKPGIKLNVTHELLPEEDVLKFLAGNDINAFFYEEMLGRGASSATDYALSVNRPIIVSDTYMFRHITRNTLLPITFDKVSIQQAILNGTKVLQPLYDRWTHENYIKDFEEIFDEILR